MFYPYTRDTGALQPWEEMPAAAGTYKAGQALSMANGAVTTLSGPVNKADYISMFSGTAQEGQMIPVIRATERIIFKTELAVDEAALTVGTKMTVNANRESVMAAENGGFEVTAFDGNTAGSVVYGRFV